MKTNLSKHASIERKERLSRIIDTIGLGNEIFSFTERETGKLRTVSVTDTGVAIIKSKEGIIVTAYPATEAQMIYFYQQATGKRYCPANLVNRARKNQKLFSKK